MMRSVPADGQLAALSVFRDIGAGRLFLELRSPKSKLLSSGLVLSSVGQIATSRGHALKKLGIHAHRVGQHERRSGRKNDLLRTMNVPHPHGSSWVILERARVRQPRNRQTKSPARASWRVPLAACCILAANQSRPCCSTAGSFCEAWMSAGHARTDPARGASIFCRTALSGVRSAPVASRRKTLPARITEHVRDVARGSDVRGIARRLPQIILRHASERARVD